MFSYTYNSNWSYCQNLILIRNCYCDQFNRMPYLTHCPRFASLPIRNIFIRLSRLGVRLSWPLFLQLAFYQRKLKPLGHIQRKFGLRIFLQIILGWREKCLVLFIYFCKNVETKSFVVDLYITKPIQRSLYFTWSVKIKLRFSDRIWFEQSVDKL